MSDLYYSTPAEAKKSRQIMADLGRPPLGIGIWAPMKTFPNPPVDPVDIDHEPTDAKKTYTLIYDGTWPQCAALLIWAARTDINAEQVAQMLLNEVQPGITVDMVRQSVLSIPKNYAEYQGILTAALAGA